MAPVPTSFAATLVRAVRAAGDGRAGPGPDAPRWAEVADAARHVALGLADAGLTPGTALRVAETGAPHERLVRELGVLVAGGTLVAPDHPDGATATLGGPDDPTAGLRSRGAAVDRADPAAHEALLAARPDAVPVLATAAGAVTDAGARWALRCVSQWLAPVTPAAGAVVVATPPGPERPGGVAALLGRWWPLTWGAALADATDLGPTVAPSSPAVVVAGPADWERVAAGVRAAGEGRRISRAVLRRARAGVAGEPVGLRRSGRPMGPGRVAARVRQEVGLGHLVVGLALGGLSPVVARELAAAGLPVVPVWVAAGPAGGPRPGAALLAPLASGPVASPDPTMLWGRPLPGRDIRVTPGAPTVALGGDVGPAGVPVAAGPVPVDGRGRIRLPVPRRDGGVR